MTVSSILPSCLLISPVGIVKYMYLVQHPLDWWAYGGYTEVVRQTGWSLPKARREVRKVINHYGLRPIGHAGYTELRQAIMDGEMTDRDLT